MVDAGLGVSGNVSFESEGGADRSSIEEFVVSFRREYKA